MKHATQDELLRCERCGALIGLGRYAVLSREGNDIDCRSEPVSVPGEEAERMLTALRAPPREAGRLWINPVESEDG